MTHSLHLVILRQESARYHVPEKELLGRGRSKTTAHARHVAWHRMHTELNIPISKLARMFGRHHCSIGYAISKIAGGGKYGAGLPGKIERSDQTTPPAL